MQRFLATVILALAVQPLCAADLTVSQKGRAFKPGEIEIRRGQTLTFTNEDSFIHQIYVTGLFDTDEQGPGENLNETFPNVGTFQVRCHIHPTMRMTVKVR